MKITSKRQFFELWEAGCLGNRTRLWRDPQRAFDDATRLGIKTVGFREIRSGRAGAGSWEKTDLCNFWEVVQRWIQAGRNFIMDDGAPDQFRTIQGEICRTYRGLEGFISIGTKLPMRQDMAAGNMVAYTGLTVLQLLTRYMDPSSRDDVDAIFELYPDAAIEFTCFSVNAGVVPGRNTIFWEVRDY